MSHTPLAINPRVHRKAARGVVADALLAQYFIASLVMEDRRPARIPPIRRPTANDLIPIDLKFNWAKREERIHLHHVYARLVSWSEGNSQFISFVFLRLGD